MKIFCDCGEGIFLEKRWNGIVSYYIMVEEGKVINHCPGCGEYITKQEKQDKLIN